MKKKLCVFSEKLKKDGGMSWIVKKNKKMTVHILLTSQTIIQRYFLTNWSWFLFERTRVCFYLNKQEFVFI